MSIRDWYDRHLLPYLIDFACGMPVVAAQRRKVIPQAAGQVLEIGIGTGLNLKFYDRQKVTRLVAIDPAEQMHHLARRRSERAGLTIELRSLAAERLPLDASSFDCVVCTYTLCSVFDPVAALAEVRRVLRPGGTLLFAEHGLAPDVRVAHWQHRIGPYSSRFAGGCHHPRCSDPAARCRVSRPRGPCIYLLAKNAELQRVGRRDSGVRAPENALPGVILTR